MGEGRCPTCGGEVDMDVEVVPVKQGGREVPYVGSPNVLLHVFADAEGAVLFQGTMTRQPSSGRWQTWGGSSLHLSRAEAEEVARLLAPKQARTA